MNVVLLVVDSLRARALERRDPGPPRTPFLEELGAHAVHFRRAYATECWTLPTHMSMFTGQLPSVHGAHFQRMEYARTRPTIAELLGAEGFHTEVVTRNSLFDGTVPGATRGFQANTRLLGTLGAAASPLGLVLALSKPRLRRLIESSGFFTLVQKQQRDILLTLARMGVPADERVLTHVLERMAELRRRSRPFFLFANLYDVHAPYSPSPHSPLRSFRSFAGWRENLALPWLLPKVSSHAYLRPGFQMAPSGRHILLDRYHRAIELMDAKLAAFYSQARRAGLLDDTLLVVTADHGEAFGEHQLYFHDASVYDTHLRVPLWVHHPGVAPSLVDDVVSTAGLFDLFRSVALGTGLRGTLLDPHARAARPVALAEHFHHPDTRGMLPRYAQNLAAAVVGHRKLTLRHEGAEQCDLDADPDETTPEPATVEDFAATCVRDGYPRPAVDLAVRHLARGLPASVAA